MGSARNQPVRFTLKGMGLGRGAFVLGFGHIQVFL
jgi:hypothetical protein